MVNHTIRTNKIGDFSTFFGRFLIGVVFLTYGLQKLVTFNATKGYMESIGFFWVSFILVLTIILEIVGGFSLILGYKTKTVAYILALYVLILTPIFHSPMYADQLVNFSKNLMILGGLLFIGAFGAGRISFDHKILKNY